MTKEPKIPTAAKYFIKSFCLLAREMKVPEEELPKFLEYGYNEMRKIVNRNLDDNGYWKRQLKRK